MSSSIRTFADNTKTYRELTNLERDTQALQLDINHLVNWAVQWQLSFNPTKCESMRITHNHLMTNPSPATPWDQNSSLLRVPRTWYYNFFWFIMERSCHCYCKQGKQNAGLNLQNDWVLKIIKKLLLPYTRPRVPYFLIRYSSLASLPSEGHPSTWKDLQL